MIRKRDPDEVVLVSLTGVEFDDIMLALDTAIYYLPDDLYRRKWNSLSRRLSTLAHTSKERQ